MLTERSVAGSVAGEELANPKFHPFWAKCEELGVLVFMHPLGTRDGPREGGPDAAGAGVTPAGGVSAMVTLIVDHAAASGHAHGCEPPQPDTSPSKEPVPMPPVTVNGVVISRKAIAAEVQNQPARNPGEGWRAATHALVIRELLVQEAGRLGVPIEPRTATDYYL